jgi:hypothetical protein
MKNKPIAIYLVFIYLCAGVHTCEAQGGPGAAPLQITPTITRELIDSLGQVLYDHYIFPDTARKWAAYLEAQFKKGAYAEIKDPNDLADRLQHWEGTGVIPDIPVSSAGALEVAEKAFFTKWAQTAATGPEKAQAQWQLDDMVARSSPETRNPASLTPYIGTYQGLVFYTDPSGFYCRNAERGNQVYKLIPISNDKFILDENVHVEFTKDEKANVTGYVVERWAKVV